MSLILFGIRVLLQRQLLSSVVAITTDMLGVCMLVCDGIHASNPTWLIVAKCTAFFAHKLFDSAYFRGYASV